MTELDLGGNASVRAQWLWPDFDMKRCEDDYCSESESDSEEVKAAPRPSIATSLERETGGDVIGTLRKCTRLEREREREVSGTCAR